jgi:hypothetical protein
MLVRDRPDFPRGIRGQEEGKMTRNAAGAVALVSAILWMGIADVQAAVLCQKKSGAVFSRTTCKKKETLIDVASFLGDVPTRLTTAESSITSLQSSVTSLQSNVASALTKTSTATVAAYATVASDGTLAESYSKTGATVTSSRAMLGDYTINFGFQIRPNQPIVAVPRETFGHEICRVFLGTSPVNSVSLFCANADAGSPAADVAFTIVVFN